MVNDPETNALAKPDQEALLSSPQSKVEIWLIPTNEEVIIARQTHDLTGARSPGG